MSRPTVKSGPVNLGVKPQDQIFVTVRQFQFCRRGAPSLTRGQVCHSPRSQSVVLVICIYMSLFYIVRCQSGSLQIPSIISYTVYKNKLSPYSKYEYSSSIFQYQVKTSTSGRLKPPVQIICLTHTTEKLPEVHGAGDKTLGHYFLASNVCCMEGIANKCILVGHESCFSAT